MKKIILILIGLFIFTAFSFAQSIEETKDFITQNFESHPPASSYGCLALFGNQGSTSDIDRIIGDSNHREIYDRVLAFVYSAKNKYGSIAFEVSYTLDIKGISNIIITKDGEYDILDIYMKPSYLMKSFSTIYGPDGKEKKEQDILKITMTFKSSDNISQRMKKSLYHLCNLYGGSPQKELFTD